MYFDAGGYCISSRRIEKGGLGGDRTASWSTVSLSRTAFESLLEGLDVPVRKQCKRRHPPVSGALGRV
ncbi:hypothetical protein [Salinisphaera sp. LB1]|uniref:hypothetical protein n=1 Tax=Salinisphaera sp. LB1 TaxID=2183911 RepID=UPI0013140EFC